MPFILLLISSSDVLFDNTGEVGHVEEKLNICVGESGCCSSILFINCDVALSGTGGVGVRSSKFISELVCSKKFTKKKCVDYQSRFDFKKTNTVRRSILTSKLPANKSLLWLGLKTSAPAYLYCLSYLTDRDVLNDELCSSTLDLILTRF
jgi:hypothetical protein